MKFKNLKIEKQNKIIMLTLNRPEKLNVLSKDLLVELRQYLTNLRESIGDVRGVILTGAGNRAFSVGGDIKLMNQLEQQGGEDLSRLAQAITVMIEGLPVPVIACVDGFALGGGSELAMSCDFIYATSASVFGQPETKIGLIPGFGGNVRLSRMVGVTMAKELIYTGRQITAEEAQRIGLVNRVFTTRKELISAALKTLKEIIGNSSHAVAVAKSTLELVVDQPMKMALSIEQMAYGKLFNHPEKAEGIQAFLQKRPPNF